MSAVVVTAGFPDGTELTVGVYQHGRLYIRADNPGGGFHLNLDRAEAERLRDQLTAALNQETP